MTNALRVVTAVMGAGILVIGLDAVIRGADAIPGTSSAAARIDSEVRFFAAWYALAGALLLLAAARRVAAPPIVIAVGAGFFLAACGRLLSWATVGQPETFQVVLMYVEFAIAVTLIPWQIAVTNRREEPPRSQP